MKSVIAVVVALAFASSAHAETITINFDSLASPLTGTYKDQGVNLDSLGTPGFVWIHEASQPEFLGQPALRPNSSILQIAVDSLQSYFLLSVTVAGIPGELANPLTYQSFGGGSPIVDTPSGTQFRTVDTSSLNPSVAFLISGASNNYQISQIVLQRGGAVPEPSSVVLAGLGLAGAVIVARKKKPR